jgi:NADPH-dependent glutamate synthase beta subunit-like oxidoreductase
MTEKKPLYLNKAQLKAELDRCLNCKTQPCMHACPVNCSPQEFINHAKEGDFDGAVKTILRNNPLGQTCGLICPDKFCMKACIRNRIDFAVNIPKVQATILENYRREKESFAHITPNGVKVAVIGAGPAGLAASSVLAKAGCKVVLFEDRHQIGGALNLIPDERLPHEVIEKDWSYIFNPELVELKLNHKVADVLALKSEFDWVIVASGEPNLVNLGIEGEEYAVSYMEYLSNPKQYATTGKVAIIGGGNVAADCAFTAKAGGAAEVEMFVRRRIADMRISKAEHLELLEREIDISPMTSPDKIELDSDKFTLYVHKNRFVDGKLTPIENSSLKLSGFSLVIKAIGSRADSKIEDERIIYAGDCKTGGSTIVEAISSGMAAAELILEHINS